MNVNMISIIINTKNSAQTIENTLKSIESLVDDLSGEIVIMDMGSTDETLKIVRKFRAKVFSFEGEGSFVEVARNAALKKAVNDWVLVIDSDEEIKPDLGGLIKKIILNKELPIGVEQADGYFLVRENIIFNYSFKATGWYPDFQLRLFKRKLVNWPAIIHSIPEITGKTFRLPSEKKEWALIHHNYATISQFWQRADRYSSIQTTEKEIEKHKLVQYLSDQFWGEFWRRFFQSEGWKDGAHGMVLALFQANVELMAATKVWQECGFFEQKLTIKEWQRIWNNWQRSFNYWRANCLVNNSDGFVKIFWKIRRKFKF